MWTGKALPELLKGTDIVLRHKHQALELRRFGITFRSQSLGLPTPFVLNEVPTTTEQTGISSERHYISLVRWSKIQEKELISFLPSISRRQARFQSPLPRCCLPHILFLQPFGVQPRRRSSRSWMRYRIISGRASIYIFPCSTRSVESCISSELSSYSFLLAICVRIEASCPIAQINPYSTPFCEPSA